MADPTIESLEDSKTRLGQRLGELAYRRLRLGRELEDADQEIKATEAAIRALDQARRDAETARVVADAIASEAAATAET